MQRATLPYNLAFSKTHYTTLHYNKTQYDTIQHDSPQRTIIQHITIQCTVTSYNKISQNKVVHQYVSSFTNTLRTVKK